MTSPERAPVAELAALREENQQLREQLTQANTELLALNKEIAETNVGVVALYAEIDDKATQLAQVSELKSRFLSYMSHEFRTPLGSIHSIMRILAEELDGPLSTEQHKQVELVRRSANELTEMVDDLLDLAKVEAGRITVSPAWFDMVELFLALRGLFGPIIANSRVSLVFQEPVDMPRIYTDDRKLSHILRNFISNALKFTPVGEVRVSAKVLPNSRIRFSVADNGIGIAKEHQHALFKDFLQIDNPIQKRLRGTGLGLSLSQKYAELLQGTIEVQSDLGKGSTFSVIIPSCLGIPPPMNSTEPHV